MRSLGLSLQLMLIVFLTFSCKKKDDGGPRAVYEVYGSQQECEVVLSGDYNKGIKLDSSLHYALVKVSVKSAGNYNITTPVFNGIRFSGSGNLNVSGDTSIRLTGSGTPDKTGTVSFLVPGETSFCQFPVNITLPTVYTIDCGGAIVEGDYIKDTVLNPTNRISVIVTSDGPGTLTLTGSANGMDFIGYADFTAAGTDIIVLTGSGTPVSSGETEITLVGGNTSCVVKFTVY